LSRYDLCVSIFKMTNRAGQLQASVKKINEQEQGRPQLEREANRLREDRKRNPQVRDARRKVLDGGRTKSVMWSFRQGNASYRSGKGVKAGAQG